MVKLQEILIGNIAVKLNLLTPEQLQECLNEQEKSKPRKPLGLIMVEKGFITKEKLDELLKMQQETIQRKSEEYQRSLQDNLFGRIVIAKKWATPEQVHDVVREQADLMQKGVKKRLGALFVEKGILTEQQVKEVLEIQNKKVLYCEKCDLIFTVEWVLGRVYACTKCGARLLVPPKTIIVTETDAFIPKQTTKPVYTGPKISLPKEEIEAIYKKMEERVSKIEIKPITTKKEENLVVSFLKFIFFKPVTFIGMIALVGGVIFINYALQKKEETASQNVTVKLPTEIDTSFLNSPDISRLENATEFNTYIALPLRQFTTNNIRDLCNIINKDGKFLNVKTGNPVTLLEAQECENTLKSKIGDYFGTLYYLNSDFETYSDINPKTGEVTIKLSNFYKSDADFKDRVINYKDKKISVGSILYIYGSSFGIDKNSQLTLVLSWCKYENYKGAPLIKFTLPAQKVKGKELANHYIKIYFFLLPYFHNEGIVFGKLIGVELLEKGSEKVKDTFLCKEIENE